MHAVQDHYADPILDSMVSQEIIIDNRDNSNEHTDYQVAIELESNDLIFGSQNSLRFVDQNLQIIDCWAESFPDKVWFEIPKIPGSAMCGLRILENRASFESVSNGDGTFDFFDNFDTLWERYGNVISFAEDGYQEPSVIYDSSPQILTNETNVFKMWLREGWGTGQIYYAESTNGKNWTWYGSNPVIVASLYCPFVFKSGSTFYLYVKSGSTLKRYHSSNGTSWTDDGTVLSLGSAGQWDDDSFGNPYIWVEGASDWKMLYEAHGGDGVWKIGLATSSDGTSWSKSGSNPVISESGSVCGPFLPYSTKTFNGYYYLWVHGAASGNLPTDGYRYRSADLLTWEAFPSGVTYARRTTDEGKVGSVGQVADVTLLEYNGQVYMWYTASSNGGILGGNAHIKLAIADMTFAELVTKDENKIGDLNTDKWTSQYDAYATNGLARIQYNSGGHSLIRGKDFFSPDGIAYRARLNYNSDSNRQWFGMDEATYANTIDFDANISAGILQTRTVKVGTATNSNVSSGAAAYHTYEVLILANSVKFYIDNILKNTHTTNIPIISLAPTCAVAGASGDINADWILIRKYSSPEPTAEIGAMI